MLQFELNSYQWMRYNIIYNIISFPFILHAGGAATGGTFVFVPFVASSIRNTGVQTCL